MKKDILPIEGIAKAILVVRGHKILLDRDLAALYGVQTKALNLAVKRNRSRFPEDFMFRLSADEAANLRLQFETSSSRWGGLRYCPTAFTEQGVAMLSSVLRSSRAIHVNVEIMRAFVRLREILGAHKELSCRLDELESKYDEKFRSVFDAIRQLMTPPAAPRKQIGFGVRERHARYLTRTGR